MRSEDAHGWRRWLPGLAVLTRYDRTWLRGDLLAGITVAAYLIPQVMAYAEIIGLPPVVGLWAVVAPVIVYALLGTSRQLSIGPESTTALMTAAAIVALSGADPDPGRRAGLAALVALAIGVVCAVGAVARLGFLANLLSKPVLVGYLAGIGLLMVISQYGNLTGLAIAGADVWTQTGSLLSQASAVHVPTLVLGLAVTLVLFALRRWAPSWPGPLLVMLGAAALVAFTGVGSLGLAVVGELPPAVPGWVLPDFSSVELVPLLEAALGVAVVAYSDVIVTGRAFAARRGERIEANSELLALGAANLANGFLGSMPVSSSASRTVIGDSAGSRTQLHSLVAAVTVVLSIFFLSPVLAAFPQAALAGLVVYAGLRLVDVAELRRIAAFRLSELVLALVTMAAVLVTGLLNGIAIAVALSLLDLIRRIVHPHDGVLGYVPGLAGMHDVDDYPDAAQVPGLVVYRYDSPLFFANADDFLSRALACVDQAPAPPQWFLLNAEANIEIDLTALDALERLRATLTERGIVFAMARVKMEIREQLNVGGFIDRVGAARIFPTLPTAVAAFDQWRNSGSETEPPAPPSRQPGSDG